MDKAEVLKKYNDFSKRIEELENVIHVNETKDTIKKLELKMGEDGF